VQEDDRDGDPAGYLRGVPGAAAPASKQATRARVSAARIG
jgi:hypothetical protein